MGLLDIFRPRRTNPDARLLGCWHLVRCEGPMDVYHGIELDIRDDGVLLYSVDTGSSWQISRLIWRLDGPALITDQSSAPGEERTIYAFEPDGQLRLDHADSRTWYERGPKRAPEG